MNDSAEDLNHLIDKAMRASNRVNMRPAITKELLHYDILYCLDAANLLDQLTFQGGTALRLCYGAERYSEDLDFAGGIHFDLKDLLAIKDCLTGYIGKRYGLEVSIKEPNQEDATRSRGIKVHQWQIAITTAPAKKDLPKQRIKIEIVNVNAYSRVPKALQRNYDFLPDGYSDTLVMTETLDEIMADKLIAFVNCQRYIRYRDIWDLRWLKQQGAVMNPNYLKHKIEDYQVEAYSQKLNVLLEKLDDIVRSKQFNDEMRRFIPVDILERTLQKDKFIDYLINKNKILLSQVSECL